MKVSIWIAVADLDKLKTGAQVTFDLVDPGQDGDFGSINVVCPVDEVEISVDRRDTLFVRRLVGKG